MKYYWCVNCGYHGVFSFNKLRGVACESCNYDALTEFEKEEWVSEGFDKQHENDKVESIYDGRLKEQKNKNGR